MHSEGSKAGKETGSRLGVPIGGCGIVLVGAGRRVGDRDVIVGTGESIAPGSAISVAGWAVVQALVRIENKINIAVNL